MYRFFLLFLMIAATAAGIYWELPWYLPAVAGVVLSLIIPVWRRGGFWFCFLGTFIVWGLYTGYIHFESEGRLSDRLAVTFGVASGWALVLLTALYGGFTAGLGGLFGASVRRTIVAARARPRQA